MIDRSDVDTLVETVREALSAWDHEREERAIMPETSDAHDALSDLAARAREAEDDRQAVIRDGWAEIRTVIARAEAAEADREKFRKALIRITDKRSGDPSASEIARCALGWPAS